MINIVRNINGKTRLIGLLDGEPIPEGRVQFMNRLMKQRLDNPTDGEIALQKIVDVLRGDFLTKKQMRHLLFRREVPIHFSSIKARLADFVIRANHDRLIIEVDGGIHADKAHLDEWNDEMLIRVGRNKVLRFTNEEVLTRKTWVLFQICGTLARECDVRPDTRDALWKAVSDIKGLALMEEPIVRKYECSAN